MLSNNGTSRGKPLHDCTCERGAYANWSISVWRSCKSFSQSTKFAFLSIWARIGKVLIKSPTMDSTSGNCAGRPEQTTPKIMSSLPVLRLSSNAQAPCTIVFRVTRHWRESACNRAVESSERLVCCSWKFSPEPLPGERRSRELKDVDASKLSRKRLQKSAALARSCSRSHCIYLL